VPRNPGGRGRGNYNPRGLPRLLSVVVVVFLLGGTAAAFAVTQGLKLERTPVLSPSISKTFSPVCECDRDRAQIGFRLREGDNVTLQVVDGDGDVVRTLFAGRRFGAVKLEEAWDGRGDDGQVVPDGDYRPRVRLADAHRTIVFPNEMRVDTVKPQVERFSVSRRVFSPDGDLRADGVSVAYGLDERARVRLLVNGKPRVRKRGQAQTGAIQWYGRFRGRPARPGTYALALVAVDEAGNRSRRVPAGPVRVRYIELGLDTIRVQAGRRFGVRVRTDARRYGWLFARGRGSSTARYLVLRAPMRPGRYRLFVETNGHGTSAAVAVRP
jgi:flagellar hook capping protein FlgD